MHCHDVKRVIYFFLDGTLGGQRLNDLRDHLGVCPECEARRIVHQRMREFFRRRLTPVSAPPRLKQRLTRSLRAFAE